MSPVLSSYDQETDRVNPLDTPAQGKPVPGPRGLELARCLLRMRKDPHGLLVEGARRYGDVMSLPTLRTTFLFLNHPEHVAHVLQRNAKNYRKSLSYRELELVLGKGLLTSDGELWRRQRRLEQPAFQRKHMSAFAPTVVRLTQEMLEGWNRGPVEEAMDVHAETMRLTLRIAGQALFSTDLAGECDQIGQGLRTVLPFVARRTESLFNWPASWPLPSHLRFRRALRSLDAVVYSLIEGRRAAGQAAPRDLLSMLVFARDPETGEGMDPKMVRDEVITLMLAGHETTANALAWSFHLLAQHPEIEARLHEEARSVLGGRDPGIEDLPSLELARRVVLESMRLLPPAWLLEREALADDVVCGWSVPKGSVVMLSPYSTHRHPDFWEEPERFDPDRFAPERSAGRPRCAYFPFGAGQRQCIGEDLAMLEMQLILPMVVQRWKLEPVAGPAVELEAGITLRPRQGISMHRTRR